MLKMQYKIKTGRQLNLKDPKRYTEKLQWYKLNYKNPIMHRCVDKYQVREFIKEKGLEEILVKLYAKSDSVKGLDFERLPDQFVIKTTNGGGGLNVIVCPDKTKLDRRELEEKLACKKIKSRTGGREWAYYGLEPGVIVEELLINSKNPLAGVNDYKIFCYQGKAKYIVVDVDRYVGHKRNFYDRDWNRLEYSSDCPPADCDIEKPENYEKMLQIAEKLSEDFPYVRVDLYNVEGKIYFGELTFYPWSGYVQFEPDEADFVFGKDFELKSFK
ncbi:MAG: carbonic anhydrase [Clostridia bacterium]|nr:carbonic anhydrase [Clostridia bacterium]